MMRLQDPPNKKEGERTILLLRRHWIIPLKTFFFCLFSAVLPIGIYLLIHRESPQLLSDPVMGPVLAVALSFYFLAVWMFTFQEIVDYYLDMWIVTNERIIDIEQFGLFHRASSELHLESIVDVSSEVRGMMHTFLNYGDVLVQSAAEQTHFHFREIPHPELVRQQILKAVDEDRMRHQRAATSPPTSS